MITQLKTAEAYLKNKGIDNPLIESEHILCELLGCNRLDLYTKETSLDQELESKLHELLGRRVNGEPLQYILGKAEFYGFELKVGKGVFIPRPETEILVDEVLAKSKELRAKSKELRAKSEAIEVNNYQQRTTNYQQRTILDLCTGSGNIAISLTKMLPYYKIFASDVSKQAVSVAGENAELNNISDSVELRCGSLFEPWQDKKKFFDIIVCNPPYIRRDELQDLPQDVKNEPLEALNGGEDGLCFYKKLIDEAVFYLKEKGFLFFEISPEQVDDLKILLNKCFTNIKIVKDYNGLDRVISARI